MHIQVNQIQSSLEIIYYLGRIILTISASYGWKKVKIEYLIYLIQ